MFVRLPHVPGHTHGGGALAAVIAGAVLNIDVAPTLLDPAGYPVAAAADMDGRSMLPLLVTAAAPPPAVEDGSLVAASESGAQPPHV